METQLGQGGGTGGADAVKFCEGVCRVMVGLGMGGVSFPGDVALL